LNWKGENFYTGNHVAVLMNGQGRLAEWLNDERSKGVQAVFLVTEWGSLKGLESSIGEQKITTVSSRRDSNQFVLARVEL
jgi:hypothetical protein